MQIRSFRRVFRLDRRIYKIDPFSGHRSWLDMLVPPNGIPVRGLVYFLGLLALSFLALLVPGLGLVWGVVPWPLRHILLPGWLAAAGYIYNPDGRRADLFLVDYAAWQARRVQAWHRRPRDEWNGKLRVRWDEHDTRLHRARVHGPARVVFRVPVRVRGGWRGHPIARPGAGESQVITVDAGRRLEIRP